jgi:hypothetical protein
MAPAAPPQSLRAKPGVRELSFTDPDGERRSPDGGPRRGGRDRRRTGAR